MGQDKLREKSFLDPSQSLGMTGLGPSPLRLSALAGDNPKLTGARSAPYENLRVRSLILDLLQIIIMETMFM